MKAYAQKLIGTVTLGLTLFSNSIPVLAGLVALPEVTIETVYAMGSMAGARYSVHSQQYIGCTFANSYGPSVLCSARDKTGQSLFCTSTDANAVAVVKTITDFSYIQFTADYDSTCAQLIIWNSS